MFQGKHPLPVGHRGVAVDRCPRRCSRGSPRGPCRAGRGTHVSAGRALLAVPRRRRVGPARGSDRRLARRPGRPRRRRTPSASGTVVVTAFDGRNKNATYAGPAVYGATNGEEVVRPLPGGPGAFSVVS